MAAHDDQIEVEVVYATPDDQLVHAVRVPRGTTLRAAVVASGVLERYPRLDVDRCVTGIFGERANPDTLLSAGDRIEIYRPLIADPKQSRRRRAAKRAVR